MFFVEQTTEQAIKVTHNKEFSGLSAMTLVTEVREENGMQLYRKKLDRLFFFQQSCRQEKKAKICVKISVCRKCGSDVLFGRIAPVGTYRKK